MITVKGFYTNLKLVNNAADSTAVFGELTQYASTFARDFKAYTRGDSQVSFCLFSCKDGAANTTLSTEFIELGCEIGEWAYSVGPNITNTNTKNDFIQMMQNQFGARVKSVSCGDLVTDTIRRMPQWLSWEADGQAGTYRYKIWLASLDFESSYDEFEILVVPPVDRIDTLFQPYPDLLIELSKNTLQVLHERMTQVRGKFPETIVQTEMVELIDRTNTNNRTQIGWTALIYGPAGNTTDNIKDAIKKYISINSTNTENDWRLLMPDLFNTTCFYVIPRWDRYAIAPRLAIPGIHSPVSNSMENFNYTRTVTSAYVPNAHLQDNLEVTMHRYKDITLNIVGGEFNRLDLFKFTDYFPDYIAENSTSEDFNRQKQATKDITTLLTLILKKIDQFETDPSIPVNLRLIEKYGQRFVVGKYNNIEYYVLMKPTQQP